MNVLSSVLLIALPLFSGHPSANCRATSQERTEDRVYTPDKGTPERKAILDSVRAKLKTKNQFEVNYLKANQRWAYFRGNAVVFTEDEKIETDSVQALLEKGAVGGKSSWVVVEVWNLEQQGTEEGFRKFVEGLRRRQKDKGIPEQVLPEQL